MMGLEYFLRRQSRIRRGQGRAAADAERRLPSGRRMPGAASASPARNSAISPPARSRRAPARPCFLLTRSATFDGIPVAFIGLTLKGTAGLVSPAGIAGLEFRDEAETVNALIPELKARGVEAIVVLIHEGGLPTGDYNECPGISGPIVDIVKKFDQAVDVVVTGHTHRAYVCEIDGRLVTQATNTARSSPRSTSSSIPPRATSSAPRPRTASCARDAREERRANRADRILRQAGRADRQPPGGIGDGNAVARAQRCRRKPARRHHRGRATRRDQRRRERRRGRSPSPIPAASAPTSSRKEDGAVTYGDLFASQPFRNQLVTMTLTGKQIKDMLEQQWLDPKRPRILQVSKGFSYAWDGSKPDGERVIAERMSLNGAADRSGRELSRHRQQLPLRRRRRLYRAHPGNRTADRRLRRRCAVCLFWGEQPDRPDRRRSHRQGQLSLTPWAFPSGP